MQDDVTTKSSITKQPVGEGEGGGSSTSTFLFIRNSLLAGSAAGIASTFVCHPFDVLRVKMQSSAPVTATATTNAKNVTTVGLVGTLRNTLHYGGGMRALYTGLAMPLFFQAIYKSTIFTVNSMTESYIRDWKTQENQKLGGRNFEVPYRLTLTDRFISGFMGGAINAALFCTPVEYVRNQQIIQIGSSSSSSSSSNNRLIHVGPISVIKRTIESNGITGLWRGAASTVLRDSVGCGFFFVAMAYSQEQLTPPAHSSQQKQPPSTPIVILSGALAGVSFWLWALPVDTMKTWIQNGTATNMRHALEISQRQGFAQSIQSLFRGWQVAYSRGAPSAAITVLTYSLVSQHLQE
ncbi:MAG: solute carrier family 25 carnitine/acylcarnitine transporter 20/29 [Bacillariaceae sp.]|jgi:solute carrier family 25 carnitine/acylcarnitine transporter 20/29